MNFNQNCSAKWPIKQRSAVAKCPFQGNDLAWSWSWKYIDQRYPKIHCQFTIVSTYRMFMNNIDFWKNGTFWLMFVCLLVLELGSDISHGDAHSSLCLMIVIIYPWGHDLPLCYFQKHKNSHCVSVVRERNPLSSFDLNNHGKPHWKFQKKISWDNSISLIDSFIFLSAT